jgi:hypothetical protein
LRYAAKRQSDITLGERYDKKPAFHAAQTLTSVLNGRVLESWCTGGTAVPGLQETHHDCGGRSPGR